MNSSILIAVENHALALSWALILRAIYQLIWGTGQIRISFRDVWVKPGVLTFLDSSRILTTMFLALFPVFCLRFYELGEEEGYFNPESSEIPPIYGPEKVQAHFTKLYFQYTILDGVLPFVTIFLILVNEIQRVSTEIGALKFYLLISWALSTVDTVARIESDSMNTMHFLFFMGKTCLTFLYICLNRNIQAVTSAVEITDELLESLLTETDDKFDVEVAKLKQRTPESSASLFSRLTFMWMQPLMKKGYAKPLEKTDFYKILEADESRTLSAAFQIQVTKIWQERERNGEEMANKDIVVALHRAGVFAPFYEAFFFKIIYDTLNFVPPQMLNRIIAFISDESQTDLSQGFYLTAILAISGLSQTLLLHQYFHRVYRTGIRVRSVLLTSIYQKGLKLANKKEQKSTGEVVNLMSTDCTRLQMLFTYLHIVWSACYVILLSLFFLWQQIQYAVFVPLVVICCFSIPMTKHVTDKIKAVQKKLMSVKDSRLKLTTETINSIKTVKMYGWQDAFFEKLTHIRTEELSRLRTYYYWRMGSRMLWNITPIIVTLSAFVAYFALNTTSDFGAARAFTSLSLLNLLRFPLAVLPSIINSISEASVSLTRIGGFLSSPESKKYTTFDDKSETAVKVKESKFYWEIEKHNLALSFQNSREHSWTVKHGDLCMVTGKVGSGKSALLKMLVGDLIAEEGASFDLNSTSICYASQVPFIQNSTLKDNIVFHHPFDKKLYKATIKACALEPDLQTLPSGDETEIGERGINLSGGQKARISLARCVYASNFTGDSSKTAILLLENVFEAVDEHVGDHIWTNVFESLLKQPSKEGKMRTVICVTHALKRLRSDVVQNVVVMKEGRISIQGTFEELSKSGDSDFHDLLDALEKTKEVADTAQEPEGKDTMSELDVSAEGDLSKPHRRDSVETEASKTAAVAVGKDLTGEEERGIGQVSGDVYMTYLRASGGFLAFFLSVFSYVAQTAADFLTTRWLAYWSSMNSVPKHLNLITYHNELSQYMPAPLLGFSNSTAALQSIPDLQKESYYLGVYGLLALSSIVCMIASLAVVLWAGFRASKRMYKDLLDKVLHAKMGFFDTTPSGRILNRFSKDIYTIDEVLPYAVSSFLSTTFSVVGSVFSISYVAPWFLILLPFLFAFYRYIQKYYIASSRELQRWDSVLRSPIYSFFTETLEGKTSVRAYALEEKFIDKNHNQLSDNLEAYYLNVSANRWLAVRLECIGTTLSVSAAFLVVLQHGTLLEPGLAGLALSYAMSITQSLNWTVRMVSDVETNMVSVERLAEYNSSVDSEPNPKERKDLNKGWPSQGLIEFESLKAQYRPGLPLVIKGITLNFEPGDKVGIVGRTGAGKSSLFVLLMRLVEPLEGRIKIDGVDIADVPLGLLRQKLAIIPQDPVMFAGSLRFNLDPTDRFADEEMVKALDLAHLLPHLQSMIELDESSSAETKVTKHVLDLDIVEGGSNFSFGQRQLICIARAILRNCKVLLLDEATSGIDLATDAAIQSSILSEFKESTVLTVAHRIETILGGNKVLVMDDGMVAEYDEPKKLLEDPNSKFAGLVNKLRHTHA